MNCTLGNDIASRQCRFASGEIESDIWVYDVSDVVSLEFDGDNRLDDNNRISYIHVNGKSPYNIKADSAEFSSEWNDETRQYDVQLSITVSDVTREIAEALSQAHNGKYFVAFRVTGDEEYMCNGFRNGMSVKEVTNAGAENLSTTITFAISSEYPTLWVDKDNFNPKRIFTPILSPDYATAECELDEDGNRTGYAIAAVVKCDSSSGKPLDRDGRMCEVTGNKPAAYVLEGREGQYAEYDIIGTFTESDTFDGKPVRIYDLVGCSIGGGLNVTPSEVYLSRANPSAMVTVDSTHSWRITNAAELSAIGVYEQVGGSGGETVKTYCGDQGGIYTVKFLNRITLEEAECEVHVNIVEFTDKSIEMEDGAVFAQIPFRHSTVGGITITANSGKITYDDEYVYWEKDGELTELTITATSNDDPLATDTITLSYPDFVETTPLWQITDTRCVDGGYKDVDVTDMNPNSPKYGTTFGYRVMDLETCPTHSEPNWIEIGRECSGEDEIITYLDTNKKSATYNTLKQEIREGGCSAVRFEYYAKIAGFYPQNNASRIRFERGEEWYEIGEEWYAGWMENGELRLTPIEREGWTDLPTTGVFSAGIYTKITSPTEMTQAEADAYAAGEASKARLTADRHEDYVTPDFYLINNINTAIERETFQAPGGKMYGYVDDTIEFPLYDGSMKTSVVIEYATDRRTTSASFNTNYRGVPFGGDAMEYGTTQKTAGFRFDRVPVDRNDPNLVTQWIQDFMADKAYVRMFRNGITQVGISETGKAVFGYLATDKSTDPQDNDIFINGQGKGLTLNSNGYLRCEVTETITSLREAFKAFSASGKNCSVTEICIPLNLDCDNLTDVAYAFSAVDGADENLTKIYDLAHLDISHCTGLLRMFENRKKLETLVINYWSTSHITSWYGTFHNCEGLKTLKIGTVGALDHSTLTNDMFKGCVNLTDLHVQEIRQGLSLADCAKLNLASIRRVLYALNEPYGGRQTLTVSQATWDIIQNDETCLGYIETAGGLGWTVAR